MENRRRNIQIKFRVTEEEKKLIEKKMAQIPTQKIGAYMRKMAIDGYIIYLDTDNIKEFTKELEHIGRNINRIAKRVNSTTNIYYEDIEDLRDRLDVGDFCYWDIPMVDSVYYNRASKLLMEAAQK